MPRPLACDITPSPTSVPGEDWEPARSQLRHLPPEELTEVVRRWLTGLQCEPVRPLPSPRGKLLVQTFVGQSPLAVPVLILVLQRRNRLQVHHIDAFVGQLLRLGAPAGILITTGPGTRAALTAARTFSAPRVRVLTGTEWFADLTRRKTGLRRARLWRWLLDLGTAVAFPEDAIRRRR